MARSNLALVDCIRKAAKNIEQSENYQWGHMGGCNCGHLAQEITKLSAKEIHTYALANRTEGDWSEQTAAYCPTSGYPMDMVISLMLDKGLDVTDLKHLEKLTDPKVLRAMAPVLMYPKHNRKNDVVLYMRTWADIMENELLRSVTVEDYEKIELY
ncbi:hypothetical protein [Persicobacter psychrovividus]|uniref:Uncharacterized protein n=1 Tax=Persicobacter psychrovividus TaxID=387638 RepID=A0ABN6L6J2_9BACT|nr:hypothetical protein PEPS_10870 [Persicobacter psychrovividus]